MTYACRTWEFMVDTHLMKLQRLQNRVLLAVGNLNKSTPVHNLHLLCSALERIHQEDVIQDSSEV
jgi:hypothetical protein